MTTYGRTSMEPRVRAIGEPLSRVIYELATDQADETAGPELEDNSAWAALFRDGPDLASRILEMKDAGQLDVDPEALTGSDWAALERSAGVIVMRDAEGILTVRPYESEDDLAAAWSAVMADLEAGEPGSPTVASPESDSNPT
jgi:hypothetical protein